MHHLTSLLEAKAFRSSGARYIVGTGQSTETGELLVGLVHD